IFINTHFLTHSNLSEFESLLNKLLEQKPDLSRSDIQEMIEKKKEKIGAGYLTDQGALFLIASDLGVSLNEQLKVEMGLKDLYVGAKEITLQTRVMNVYPAKQFSRKDGSQFLLRTMTVYDSDSRAKVKLWDEKANLPGIENLKPGDLVKIIKGKDGTYARVVLWNADEKFLPKMITSDAKTRLIGVRTKMGQQGLELHGDEGTVIEIEGTKEIQPIIVRVLSMTKNDSGNMF